MTSQAGVLVVRRTSGYKDIPGVRYHFPKARYLRGMQALLNAFALLYEPRRGGTSANGGGREGFVASAFIDRIWDDPEDSTHAFVGYRFFSEFVHVVPLGETTLSPKSMQYAVRPIDFQQAERVFQIGMSLDMPVIGARQGLTEVEELNPNFVRQTREVITNRPIRDATFRYRVVEQAYRGHCAFTGVRMTNGNGRAEADAAHIQPVEAGGPDSTRNGLALMKSLHWAFDRGLISLADDGRILTVDRGLDAPVLRMLPESRMALLPNDPELQPHQTFLKWHRTNCFKGLERPPLT